MSTPLTPDSAPPQPNAAATSPDDSAALGPAVMSAAAWWSALEAAALLGTERRPVPEAALPFGPRDDADAQTRLLDQLALAATWRAAGAPLGAAMAPPVPAAPDTAQVATARALQLLDIALTQPPGGPRQRIPAVTTWLRECRRRGWRVPPHGIPELLDIAVAQPGLRSDVLAVVGERGRWLARVSPTWSAELAAASTSRGTPSTSTSTSAASGTSGTGPGTGTGAASGTGAAFGTGHAPGLGAGASPDVAGAAAVALPEDWIHQSPDDQLAALRAVRATDPDQVRAALAEILPSAPARDRVRYLETLDPPTPADEDLLESALDDRGASVRVAATRLLDALPTSARAARMAARLRPLVRETRGLLRRSLEIGLPDEPDAGGIRDGLGRAPKGVSQRGYDLTVIVAGAPLATWAELTTLSPDKVVSTLDTSPEAISGLMKAAAAQRDPTWAQALVQAGHAASGLLALLPPDRVVTYLKGHRPSDSRPLIHVLPDLPEPWGPEVSDQVIAMLAADTPPVAAHLLARFEDHLHPASVRTLQAWLARVPAGHDQLRAAIAAVISAMSFTTSISEAFR